MSAADFSKSYCRNMFRMIADPQFHDITFVVGSGRSQQQIGCNKTLLSVHCPVFEAMFKSGMVETKENTFHLPEVDPVVFRTMLHWMVSDTLRLHSITDLQPLIGLADYCQIKPLLQTTCTFMRNATCIVYVIVDSVLTSCRGMDLGLDQMRNIAMRVRLLKNCSIHDARAAIAQQIGVSSKDLQLWRVSHRKNGTIRPNRFLEDTDSQFSSKSEANSPQNNNSNPPHGASSENDDEDEHKGSDSDSGNHTDAILSSTFAVHMPSIISSSAAAASAGIGSGVGVGVSIGSGAAGVGVSSSYQSQSMINHDDAISNYILNGTTLFNPNNRKRSAAECGLGSGNNPTMIPSKRRRLNSRKSRSVYSHNRSNRVNTSNDWKPFGADRKKEEHQKGLYARVINSAARITLPNWPMRISPNIGQSYFNSSNVSGSSSDDNLSSDNNGIAGLDDDDSQLLFGNGGGTAAAASAAANNSINSKAPLSETLLRNQTPTNEPTTASATAVPQLSLQSTAPTNVVIANNTVSAAMPPVSVRGLSPDTELNWVDRKTGDNETLLFLKYFDVYHQMLSIVGSLIVPRKATIGDLIAMVRKICGWSSERELIVWEEEDPRKHAVNILDDHDATIADMQLIDGDIVVFQEKSTILSLMQLPNAQSFLAKLASTYEEDRKEMFEKIKKEIRETSVP